MRCPCCGDEMTPLTLAGRYERPVAIDHCRTCTAFWFDGAESLALPPRAVLELFAVMRDVPERPRPWPAHTTCPHCCAALLETTDAQRGTSFHYRRCPHEHGRLIGHADFLREKNFVRPLSPAERAALGERIGAVRCTGCGAPVDVASDAACRFCRTPLSILDPQQVEHVLAELRQAEAARAAALHDLPATLAADRLHVARVFDAVDRAGSEPPDLVRLGLGSLLS